MEFGIVFPPYIDAWKDAQIAEDHAFTRAWFYDSQMLTARSIWYGLGRRAYLGS